MDKLTRKVDWDNDVLNEIDDALGDVGVEHGKWGPRLENLFGGGKRSTYADLLEDYEYVAEHDRQDWDQNMWVVFKWKGQLYKVDYKYESHYGVNFDFPNCYPVKEKTVTTTIYKYKGD